MTRTALDFDGEIEFLKDYENKTGIFAPKPHVNEDQYEQRLRLEQKRNLCGGCGRCLDCLLIERRIENSPPDYPMHGICC